LKTISLLSIVVVAPEQLSCDLSGEAAILNLKSGTYYGLNVLGGRIWTLIREPQVVQSVLDRLLAEYDVEAGRCERDLITLLQELREEGLVEVKNE
jgi:coenzyme PQQ synthesis protein D (PqqD)